MCVSCGGRPREARPLARKRGWERKIELSHFTHMLDYNLPLVEKFLNTEELPET